jgi:NADH dehydrogenase
MRIAITGATGFIGRYMVLGLAREGHDVRVLCRPGREDAVVHPPGKRAEVHAGDLTRPESLAGFLAGCDLLLHLASAHDHVDDATMRAINVGGTEALIQEAKRSAPKLHFWVISSAVIGAPVYSYYRDTKRIQEKIIKGSGIEWASFRPTLVYGKGDWRHTAPLLRQCARQKGTLWIPHKGVSKINPVHVDDVVDAVIKFFDFDRGVDCMYELAGPGGIPYNEFIDLAIAATGGKVKRRNVSKSLVDKVILLKGLFTDVTKERRASAYFTLHHEHDISNAVHELDWHPRTYAQGIRETAQGDWWRYESEDEYRRAGGS